MFGIPLNPHHPSGTLRERLRLTATASGGDPQDRAASLKYNFSNILMNLGRLKLSPEPTSLITVAVGYALRKNSIARETSSL